MKAKICIAGSGKMAVNIGLYFLQREHPVHWLSHSNEHLEYIQKIITRAKKRIERFFPEKAGTVVATSSLYDVGIKQPDIIIESSLESVIEKQQIFSSLAPLVNDQTLLFSNSSSILPKSIHHQCLGAHFFFPVELTSIVELISCHHIKDSSYHRSFQFLAEAGFDIIEQDEHSAFLLNRLLLPLQAASIGALRQGLNPSDVEAASKSDLISFGQLSLMDSIGLDIVQAAAKNYRLFPAVTPDIDFKCLIESLTQLLEKGKLGAKNKNGLLMGDPLPWPEKENDKKGLHSLKKHFKQLLLSGCRKALREEMITNEQLHLAFNRLFQASAFSHDLFES